MSPYLFIISAEILANFIRRDEDVKGFMTGEVEHKLNQFADDTTLIPVSYTHLTLPTIYSV